MVDTILYRIFPSSGIAIYRQIMEQTEQMIASGALKPGDMLPSVRQLAEQLEVNPMTISKAYMLLESQSTLERLRGAGMRVAARKPVALPQEEKLALLDPLVDQVKALAARLDLTTERLIDYVVSKLKGREE